MITTIFGLTEIQSNLT